MAELSSPLASMTELTDTPNRWAMTQTESPLATWYVAEGSLCAGEAGSSAAVAGRGARAPRAAAAAAVTPIERREYDMNPPKDWSAPPACVMLMLRIVIRL